MTSPILTRDEAAPLLTAKQFERLYLNMTSVELMMYGQAMKALADGRTACVRVLTEDECRAEFDQVFGVHDETEYKQHIRLIKIQTWIASRRAMGAVKP